MNYQKLPMKMLIAFLTNLIRKWYNVYTEVMYEKY